MANPVGQRGPPCMIADFQLCDLDPAFVGVHEGGLKRQSATAATNADLQGSVMLPSKSATELDIIRLAPNRRTAYGQQSLFSEAEMGRLALLSGLIFIVVAGSASAQTTLTATNAGFIQSGVLYQNGATGNFFTGNTAGAQHRSFLSFAVPASTTAFTSVVLNLESGTVNSGPNDLEVYDVTSTIGTDPAATVFTDLGSGVLFGTATGLTSDTTFQITLNPAGVAAVNSARGSTISFGFLNPPSTNTTGNDGVFALFGSTATRQLILTPTVTVPAPVPTMSEWAMILLGTIMAGGAALYVQRRQQSA